AWTRTYLKKLGAIDNRRRGVWTMEPPGRKYLEMDPTEAATALRTAYAELRRQLRGRAVVATGAATPDDDQAGASPHLVEPDPSPPHPGDGSALLDGSASPRRLSRRQFLGSVGAVGLAAAGAVGYLGWGQPGATRRVAPARTSSVAVRRPPETPGGLSLV